mgnify:CR=1 FL=1
MNCEICKRPFWDNPNGDESCVQMAGDKRFCIDCSIAACEELPQLRAQLSQCQKEDKELRGLFKKILDESFVGHNENCIHCAEINELVDHYLQDKKTNGGKTQRSEGRVICEICKRPFWDSPNGDESCVQMAGDKRFCIDCSISACEEVPQLSQCQKENKELKGLVKEVFIIRSLPKIDWQRQQDWLDRAKKLTEEK